MKRGSKFVLVGLVIALASLAFWLFVPLIVPGYQSVSQTFAKNTMVVTLPPHKGVVVATFFASNDSAVVAFPLNSSSVNLTVISSSGSIVTKPGQLVSVKLPSPGNYSLVAINSLNSTQIIALTYGVFPYSSIQSFYTYTGFAQNVSEFFLALGIVIAAYGLYLRLKGR
jgi:hypothetical protein